MDATGTAEDPLGLSDEDVLTVAAGGATGTRTVSRSLFGNTVNWGGPNQDAYALTQGPSTRAALAATGDYGQAPAGPLTVALVFTMLRNCDLTGFRFHKHPDLTGTIAYTLWDNDENVLVTDTFDVIVDDGGWVDVAFPAPEAVTQDATYVVGVFIPDSNYMVSAWIFNGQDRVVYPFNVQTYTSNSGGTGSAWIGGGAAPTFPTTFQPANYYIDPIAEWETDLPGYTGGTGFFDQFVNGASNHAFPVGVFFSDPENLEGYAALGINTLMVGSATDTYIDAVKATGMDWYPSVHGGDMTAPVTVQEDPTLGTLVRGYVLTDEPDLISPYNSPETLLEWRNACRAIDSTRPITLNLSYLPVKNQGFLALPVGAGILVWNEDWRQYAALADILSCDFYSLAATDSFAQNVAAGTNRYGIWAYPPQVHRMVELHDGATPVWGVVESTSEFPGSPTPTQVERATWALLIAGARGIVFFDHRFADSDVTQDFAAMLSDEDMSDMVTALSARLQTLAGALHAADAGLVTSAVGTGTLAATQGGYAAGALVPMHVTSRVDGAATYVFAQSIRDGSAGTVTFTVPALASQVLTVIGEARTVTADGGGVFTDTFTGDYAVHLYQGTT